MRKRRACAEVVCASYDFSKDLHFWGFKRAHDDAAYAFALISLKDIRGTDVFTHAASVAFERVNDWTAPGIQGDCIIGTRFITFSAGSSTQGNAGFRHYGNADAHSFGSKVFDGSGGTDFCAFFAKIAVSKVKGHHRGTHRKEPGFKMCDANGIGVADAATSVAANAAGQEFGFRSTARRAHKRRFRHG